jgi:hypothetical protein
VLQSIVLPPNYAFCPFSSTLYPSSPPPSILPQIATTLSCPPTHHLLTSLLYQPHNPQHKQPLLQQQKHTQTHTKATKPSSPKNSSPNHTPFCPPFKSTFTNFPSFCL